MSPLALHALALAVAALFLKHLVTVSVQGRERMRARSFAYPEDAAHWGGTHEPGRESALWDRAARLLRNDGENHPLFFALAAAYVALGCADVLGAVYFAVYAAARWAHGVFLLWPRQPHRNRAYVVSLAVLLALAGHVALAAVSSAPGCLSLRA